MGEVVLDPPIWNFRVVRKGVDYETAAALVKKLSAKHPENDYRVVMLDGAVGYYEPDSLKATVYRVLMLRPTPITDREGVPRSGSDSCDEPVWDGPYKMRCGLTLVNGRCGRHGA